MLLNVVSERGSGFVGKLEDLILSALQHAQPRRLSMRSILKRIGVSAVERNKVMSLNKVVLRSNLYKCQEGTQYCNAEISTTNLL